jgi:meso-butanediol dehydrogenase / (S,S)-butanediol dehydrogenase / diacetyl reductase
VVAPVVTHLPPRLGGRTALVTGGGRGIGEAVARRLAAEGAHVVLLSRTAAEVQRVAQSIVAEGGSALPLVADVADVEQTQAAVDGTLAHFGRIDMLVNNAGIDFDGPLLDVPKEEWDKVIAVNLTGPFLMTQRTGRVMREQGGGAIVHVASIDAYGADGLQVAYNSSKAGLLGLNRTAATELAPYGIRSNVVSPGYVATPLTRQYVGERLYQYMSTSFARVPQNRMISVEEIAGAVAFLLSDEASAITGTELVVDGGTIANLYIVETLPSEGS